MKRTEKSDVSEVGNSTDVFGGCPVCGANDGFLNVGRVHWFVCHRHMTKWCIGSNWFRCWRFETEDIWWENAQRLSKYREVTPAFPEEPKSDKTDRTSEAECLRLGPSREDMIANGRLIDVTPTARRAGYDYRTAVTPAVWDACIAKLGAVAGDTCEERLWTLLHSLRVTWRNTSQESDEVTYEFGGQQPVRAVSMPTRVITVLLANEEMPSVTPGPDGAGIGKLAVPCHVLRAITRILAYLWDDERRHCLESNRERRETHIFSSVVTVHNWLYGDERSVEHSLAGS